MERVRLDGPGPLSESVLWRWQERFYGEQGPAAFTSGTVPWRITSSVALANAWADAAAAFASPETPLQVVELGGGTGRLAFHLLRALSDRGVRFRYLLTDLSAVTVAALERHPQLSPWIARGLLAVSRLDALRPFALPAGPGRVVVVASYLFDSLPHDAWSAADGVATAQHAEVWGPPPRKTPPTIEEIEWRFVEGTTPAPPVIAGYAARLGEGRFLWPVGAVEALEAFARALGRPHVWLVADKGPGTLEQVRGRDTATLARHGCVSASVNFDGLRAWAGWRPFLAPAQPEADFGIYGLVQGLPRAAVGALSEAWARSCAGNPPLQAVRLLDHVAARSPSGGELLQAIAFTGFDPDALLRLAPQLRAAFGKEATVQAVAVLGAALDAVWANHFALPEPHDLAFEIATVLQCAGQLSHAVAYYRRSLEQRGPSASSWFNLALCLLDLGDREGARAALAGTLAADPTHPRARALLAGS